MSALREVLAIFGTEFDDSGLKKGEKGVEGFKDTLAGLGGIIAEAFAIHEIVEFGREILEQADALAKQAIALNVSTAALQGWDFAAQLSGSSAEEFNSAFTKFNRNVAEAAKGTGPAADALKSLGLTTEEIKNKLPIDQLDQVADGLVAMQDPAKRTQTIMALFGKSGARLLPLFLEGSEGVKKLRSEVKELGAEFDESFLADAQEINDNVDRLKLGFRGIAIQGIKPLLPLLVDWTQKGIGLIKWFIGVTTQSNALKAALVTFGAVGAVKAASGIVMLAQKAGFLKNGLRGVMLELLPLVAAFLVLEDVWTFLTGGDSVTGDLIEKFFGPEATKKVLAFVSALKENVGPVLSDVFAILTDGKPLDEKLKELNNYINSTLKPQFKADFGEMADSMLKIVSAAGDVAKAVDLIASAIKEARADIEWFLKLKGPGALIPSVANAAADDNAHNEAILRDQPGRAPSAADFDTTKKPFLQQAVAFLTGFKPADAAPIQIGGTSVDPQQAIAQQQVASAPMFGAVPPPAPVVHQTLTQELHQHITADTPADLKRDTRNGAKDGLTEGGEYLRTQRALVPSP